MTAARTVTSGLRDGLLRCREIDLVVRELAQRLGGIPEGLLVLANGGYGRGDITPGSDLDVILLLDGFHPNDQFIRTFVQSMWDAGLQPGHTLLHMEDLDSSLLEVPDRAAALLESRLVCGSEELAAQFEIQMRERMTSRVFRAFARAKLYEYTNRREKYGEVVRVVEPNLKTQAGGLRDMQYVFWLERARAAREGQWTLRRTCGNAILQLLGRLRRADSLTRLEARNLASAYDLILSLRTNLRQVTNRTEDTLFVPQQVPVARRMGYHGDDRAVMLAMMRAAYQSLEKIARFADEFGTLLSDLGRRAKRKPVKGVEGLYTRGGYLELDDEQLLEMAHSPESLFALIDIGAEHKVRLAGRDRHRFRRELQPLRNESPRPEVWLEPLQRWLNLPKGFAARMRRLDELDALGAWLPEWREIAGLSTGSYYHTYTVDEHTLRALERLDALPGDQPEGLPASLWKKLEDRPLVYLSVLLHDIAKGRPGDHSQVGAEMARKGLTRVGLEQWAGDVSRLVRLHLRMEQVAFRRDSKDPGVLEEFAGEVGDRRTLDALYLLTICDLSAVSKRVWTTWKGHLLAELYLETREWFTQGRRARTASIAEEASRVAPLLDGDEGRARGFIESMREEYRRVVPAVEIAEHVRAVEALRKGADFRWLIEKREGYILLTLIAWDRTGLLADIAGLLVTQGIGIREARIFTQPDGVVIDRFRAEDTQPGGVPLEERLSTIPTLWGEIATGRVTLETLLNRHRRTRRLDRTPVALVESDIAITPQADGYMVDVSGPDSIGLLYRLCSVLAGEGLDVRAARVSRRIDGIVDSFLVHDTERGLEHQAEKLNLIQQLREALDAR